MNELIVNNYPKSSVTEAIKTIRTNLRFSSIEKDLKTILITSSMSGEGKSFVSANLAASYANSNEKVLLIDCDLRRGRQKDIFNLKIKSHRGFSNLLLDSSKRINIKDYINKTNIKNLDVLTTGTYPPNPTVLLESRKMEEILKILKENYDIIVLDTPPVTGLTDTLILSRLADIVLIVARAKKTTPEILNNTKESLEKVNATIGGVILNGTDKLDSKYYKNYYYTEE